MASRKLTHFLTTPSRVANALNWKRMGSVLSLDIGKDRIGMAVASHPSSSYDGDFGEDPVVKLDSIQLKYGIRNNRKVLSPCVLEELHAVVQENDVCGLVVGWPLQREGNLGAACGKVLHTLDCLVENSSILQNRPFCLWNEDMVVPRSPDSLYEDEWGRSPIWARSSMKEHHVASKEQYDHHEASPDVAAEVWSDFCESQWPEHCEPKAQERKQSTSEPFFDPSWLEDCEGGGQNIQMSLL